MTTIPFTAKVAVPDTTLIQESSGEAVILSLANESYYGLDDIGTHMWNALTSTDSIQKAYDIVIAEYDVDGATLKADFEGFVAELVENQLIEISGNA